MTSRAPLWLRRGTKTQWPSPRAALQRRTVSSNAKTAFGSTMTKHKPRAALAAARHQDAMALAAHCHAATIRPPRTAARLAAHVRVPQSQRAAAPPLQHKAPSLDQEP